MRRKTELITAGSLELLAVALANWQALAGVRTDEAKYLLNIPYPHPPLLRWLMSLTESLACQEFLWRLLLATLMVQAVWLVWDMTSPERSGAESKGHLEDRILVCATWLLSSAVLTMAGAVMLSPIIAMQALVLLWLRSKPDLCRKIPGWIGFFWLAMVFTSFQGILFAPLVWSVLKHSRFSRPKMLTVIAGPCVLLALWTLSNPLALATMAIHGNDGAKTGLEEHLLRTLKLWIIGGAGILSAVGTWGIVRSKDWTLIATLVLVLVYVTASVPYPFYAILFTPIFVGGIRNIFLGRRHPHAFPLLACFVFATAIITWFIRLPQTPDPSRSVMAAIAAEPIPEAIEGGSVLISGTFGHQWQYESRLKIRRYKPEFTKDARAVVCLAACAPMFDTSNWKRLPGLMIETWVRK